MVSKRERLEAAIVQEVADRPPVALWRHFPVDDQTATGLAQSAAQFQARYDFDFVKVTPASSFCLLDWGVEDEWMGSTEGTREYTKRAILELEDWKNLEVLEADQGALGVQLDALKELREQVGADVPIIQTIFSPLSQAKNLAGQARMMQHLHQDPATVEVALETITSSTLAFIAAALELGVDGIFYAIQHASYHFFDDDSYERFGIPYDLRILDAAQEGWLNVLHLHGDAIMFGLAPEYPVQIVNWHDREVVPSLLKGHQQISGAVCGGVSRRTLELGNPGQVQAEALEALGTLDGRGMVLGTGCVCSTIAPRSNIEALRTAVDFA
ncbi:MAG: uroporphyrinogen decarboxylase family protein [Anaerolineales bacterium]|jgi:uroporphyrinogen decarboxylase